MRKLYYLGLLLLYQLGFSQQINAVQYWFGDNFGSRVLSNVSTNTNGDLLFSINHPDNGINEVDAFFHCRFRDTRGNWSPIYSQQMNNNYDASKTQVQVQYWFNKDYSNNTIANITTVIDNNQLDFQKLDITWPKNAEEMHYRFKSSYNKWSSIQAYDNQSTIYKNNKIAFVEYWFGDNDDFKKPLQTIAVTANANNEISLDIPYPDIATNQLDETVNYRFVDEIGNRSPIFSEKFKNNHNPTLDPIVVQYWFDEDNIGTAPEKTLVGNNGILDFQFEQIDWRPNAQKLHYRFKSKYNQWTSIQTFDKNAATYQNNVITSVEYWFENKFGNRKKEPVTAKDNNEIEFDIKTGISESNPFNETIYYRFVDVAGNWSPIHATNLDDVENKGNQIVQVEYWLNDGFNKKERLSVAPAFDLDFRDIKVNSPNDIVHIRYKDQANRWSSIYSFTPEQPGITIITHGFQLFGTGIGDISLLSPTADFEAMGVDIINRAGGGALYKNDDNTGQLELIKGDYVFNPAKEIVLVYDWGALSNNNTVNIDFGGNGYLESAADNLLATFLKLHKLPFYNAQPFDVFKTKPKHLIAHSRGTVLMQQFLHRLATYFPEVKVDQFTLLDPHPATSFGDLKNGESSSSPPNLPGVNGVATNCTAGFGCNTVGKEVFLEIPANVLRADNYYRTDQGYEANIDNAVAFDGLPVRDLGEFNRKLNNDVLKAGSPLNVLGGAHSGVHKWYRGTINTDLDVASSSLIPLATSSYNTNRWYSGISQDMENNFLQRETRQTTGFNRSRIGGGVRLPILDSSQKIDILTMDRQLALRYGLSLAEHPDGVKPHSVNGGYFDNNNDAGWNKNCGLTNYVRIINGKAEINNLTLNHSVLKHSLMYFAESFNYLNLSIYEAVSTSNIAYPSIKITFFNNSNEPIGTPYVRVLNPTTAEIFAPIPSNLIGQVGTFQIEYGTETQGSFKIDEVKLTEYGGQTLSVAAIPLVNNFTLYPNPFVDEITISSKDQVITKVQVYDLSGKLIKDDKVNNQNKFIVKTINIPTGTYLLNIITDKGVESHKVIKK